MDNERYLVELPTIDIQMQEELFLIVMVQEHVLKKEELKKVICFSVYHLH